MEGVNRTGVPEGGSGSDDNTAADDNDAQVLRVYSMIGIYMLGVSIFFRTSSASIESTTTTVLATRILGALGISSAQS